MKTGAARLVRMAERVVGRRNLVRASRFALNHARRDGPNRMDANGELLVQAAALAMAQTRAVVFDVGANQGQWSSRLLTHDVIPVDLHVFEPAVECGDHLRSELRARSGSTVAINQAAASSEDGEAVLFQPHERAGSSSLHEASIGPTSAAQQQSVRTCRLDTYCADHAIDHVDLLKIDAEGHDFLVLLGATQLLRSGAIALVQFEYNHRWIAPRRFLKDVFDLVLPLGYRVGKVTPDGIEWYEGWQPQLETLIEGNYVAARPAIITRLPALRWWDAQRHA